jgi:photosystem II stability/assembly factor-like uncharacterized protein
MKKFTTIILTFILTFTAVLFPVHVANAIMLGCGWSPVQGKMLKYSAATRVLTFDEQSGTLLAGISHYVFKSIDKGTHWEKIGELKGTVYAILALKTKTEGILVGTYYGIFKTDNYGENWSKVLSAHVKNFAEDEKFPNIVFAGTTEGLYKSTDYGKTWKLVFSSEKSIYAIAIDSGRGIVYVGTIRGAYKSYDTGNKWVKTSLTKSVNSLVINPVNKDIVFASCGSKLFKTTDGGAHWNLVESSNLPTGHRFDLIKFQPHSSNILYVCVQYKGIYKSVDNGKTWVDISNVLPQGKEIYAFTINPKNSNIIYASVSSTIYRWNCDKIIITLKPDNPYMTVNGLRQEIDPGRGTKPVIIPKWSRTVVPIRAIVEALGGTIGWDGKERKVTIQFNGTDIDLWIGKAQAHVNGAEKWIDANNHDVMPVIINARTMLPLRFVAESLGCKVDWNGTTRTITITYEEP